MSFEQNSDISSHHSNDEASSTVPGAPFPDPESIIKENRMIVRFEYTNRQSLPQTYNQHTACQTCSVGWREYKVILRQSRLEFFKRRSRAEKVVFSESIRFSVFSPIDITLALTEPWEGGMRIVIFRPQTRALAVEWYAVLRDLLPCAWPKPKPTSCEVHVPALNDVRINIPLPSDCSIHGFTVDAIMNVVLIELRGVNEWDDVLNEWLKEDNLKLGWKRYDRIEWISPDWTNQDDLLSCPQFIEGTHQLQLRKSKHYPTQVTKPDRTKSEEPASIEGYLNVLSNNKGKKRKLPKRLYYTSHDHYLFYIISREVVAPTAQNPSSDSLITFPPPHQHHENANASNTADSERRIHQLKAARGFLDLMNVVEVKPIETPEAPHSAVNETIPPTTDAGGPTNAFEILLNNGLSITLQADSPEIMTEWIDRLNALARYWHARLSADVQIRLRVINENQNNIDDDSGGANSFFHGFQAFTDSTIWNLCVLQGCRTVTLSGRLYQKSHYHGTFVNYQHILTRGHLIYYKLHTRSTMGRSQPRICNKRSGIINLRDCYVYSGRITEHDLLYRRSNTIDSDGNKLPKIYGDGMHCNDEEEQSTFVIWKSVRRRVFGKNEDAIMLKKRLQFGKVGKVWVFKTRSRIEKLEWVLALNMEIQRVWGANEDND